MRVDAQRLSRAADAINSPADLFSPSTKEPPLPSSRLSVDPAAMAAACALRAGQVAQGTGQRLVAEEMFQMVITKFPQPPYRYYVAQAQRSLERLHSTGRATFSTHATAEGATMSLRRGLAVAVLVGLGMVTPSYAADPVLNDSSQTQLVSEQIVRGDVLMREGEFYIVKDTSGHEVRLHVNKETKLDGPVKAGDKIEARVTPEGHATSLTLQVPQNGTAPIMPGRDSAFPQQFPERLVP